jgi:putative chitinase
MADIITAAIIARFAPKASPAIVATITGGASDLAAAGVTSPLRAAHFLAQVAVETGGLAHVEESLNYSVDGLRNTFGVHRISDADCAKFGRIDKVVGGRRIVERPANQEAIANIVYGGAFGRTQLGNTEQGDGWRYRGGGMLQTTGRTNYRKAGHEDDPETLRTPEGAFRSALHEWMTRGCDALADADDVTAVRKAINGGTIGLEDCKLYLKSAKRLLGA